MPSRPAPQCDELDVVGSLLPPQIPAFLLGAGSRQSISCPPISSASRDSAVSLQQHREQRHEYGSQQQQQRFSQEHYHQNHAQHQHQLLQLPRAAPLSSSNSNTSSRRRIPTASGSSPGPTQSSSSPGSSSGSSSSRTPINVVLRGLTAGGIGAGAGGMVSVL